MMTAMNNIGVVLSAFLGGIFLIVVILALVASFWVTWDVRRQGKALLQAITAIKDIQESGIQAQTKALESGKSVFQSIRADLAKSLEAQSAHFDNSLKDFDEIFRAAIGKLNGKAMLQAAEKNLVAMRRLDEVAIALHELVISANETVGSPREWTEPARADEHAPQDASRISRSIYAQDQIDDQETEAAFNVATNGAGDLFQ